MRLVKQMKNWDSVMFSNDRCFTRSENYLDLAESEQNTHKFLFNLQLDALDCMPDYVFFNSEDRAKVYYPLKVNNSVAFYIELNYPTTGFISFTAGSLLDALDDCDFVNELIIDDVKIVLGQFGLRNVVVFYAEFLEETISPCICMESVPKLVSHVTKLNTMGMLPDDFEDYQITEICVAEYAGEKHMIAVSTTEATKSSNPLLQVELLDLGAVNKLLQGYEDSPFVLEDFLDYCTSIDSTDCIEILNLLIPDNQLIYGAFSLRCGCKLLNMITPDWLNFVDYKYISTEK